MSRWYRLAALASALLALAWHTPETLAQGYTLAPPNAAFTVWLPKKPDYAKSEPQDDDGKTYVLHRYILEANPAYFVVEDAELPAGTDVSSPRRFVEARLAASAGLMRAGKTIGSNGA